MSLDFGSSFESTRSAVFFIISSGHCFHGASSRDARLMPRRFADFRLRQLGDERAAVFRCSKRIDAMNFGFRIFAR